MQNLFDMVFLSEVILHLFQILCCFNLVRISLDEFFYLLPKVLLSVNVFLKDSSCKSETLLNQPSVKVNPSFVNLFSVCFLYGPAS